MKTNNKNRARTMSDPQVLSRNSITSRGSPKKLLLEAGSHTETQESFYGFKIRDDMPLSIRKNKSFTDNEAGSQNSAEDRVLDLKKLVQKKDYRDKSREKTKPSNQIKIQKTTQNVIPEVNIEFEPGMEAGSQTSEIEQSKSPTKHISMPIPKGKKMKTIPTHRTSSDVPGYNGKKGKSFQKNSITSFNSSAGLAIEAGSETSPGYPITLSFSNENLANTTTSRKYLNINKQTSTKGGLDFGTNAASGNDSVGLENFELIYEAEIAYFQKNFDLLERENSSSDTDGSKAISEGSSTAEGAASAAEGHHEYYYFQ